MVIGHVVFVLFEGAIHESPLLVAFWLAGRDTGLSHFTLLDSRLRGNDVDPLTGIGENSRLPRSPGFLRRSCNMQTKRLVSLSQKIS